MINWDEFDHIHVIKKLRQILNTWWNIDIVFTDELHGARLAEILRHGKLFVLPSEIEGLPLALLEAMQEGIPVLASNIPVHRQLLGDQRGMIFPVGDINACVQSLDWALAHPQELAVMAKKAQEYINTHHNWEEITNRTLNVYDKLLQTASKSIPPIRGAKILPFPGNWHNN